MREYALLILTDEVMGRTGAPSCRGGIAIADGRVAADAVLIPPFADPAPVRVAA